MTPTDRETEGEPGTTDQRPRWEGPPENRPRGYLPANDDPARDRDAAGENLADPDRSDLSDAFTTKDSEGDEADVLYLAENTDLSPLQARELIRRFGNDRDRLLREARTFKAEG